MCGVPNSSISSSAILDSPFGVQSEKIPELLCVFGALDTVQLVGDKSPIVSIKKSFTICAFDSKFHDILCALLFFSHNF